MPRPNRTGCGQEMCPNWSGDGNVCPCALFGIEQPCPLCGATLGSTDYCPSCEQERGDAHVRIVHGEWRDELDRRRFAQGCSCGWLSRTSDGWNALAEYYAHRAAVIGGCCSACGGTGGTTEPDTGGKCWDCRGTGHAHDGPCTVSPEALMPGLAATTP